MDYRNLLACWDAADKLQLMLISLSSVVLNLRDHDTCTHQGQEELTQTINHVFTKEFYMQSEREAKEQRIATTHDQIIYTSTETNMSPSLQASGNAAFVFVQITFAKLSILPLASNSSTCKLASNILVMKLRKSMAVNESSG